MHYYETVNGAFNAAATVLRMDEVVLYRHITLLHVANNAHISTPC